jgi:hypothetical protein
MGRYAVEQNGMGAASPFHRVETSVNVDLAKWRQEFVKSMPDELEEGLGTW